MPLTAAQLRTLKMLSACAYDRKRTAATMKISPHTIKSRLASIFDEWGLTSIESVVEKAAKMGII